MDFYSVVSTLNELHIDFFVTGSFAVHLYTLKRPDYQDIDVVIKEEDIEKVEKLFNVSRTYAVSTFKEEYATIKLGNIEFCTFDIRHGDKRYFFGLDQNYREYPEFIFGPLKFHVIDIEELIILKLLHNRRLFGKKDLADAKLLIKTNSVDWIKLIVQSYKHNMYNRLIELMLDEEIKYLVVK